MYRSWLDVVFTPAMFRVVVITGLSVCAFVAAAGYRKLGVALLSAGVIAGIVGAAVGFVVLIACMVAMGRAEWGGIAALIVGILAGIAATGVSFVGGIIWLVAKHKRYVQREPQWWPLYPAGAAGLLLSAWMALSLFPATHSSASLAWQVATGVDAAHGRQAQQELERRGPEAVPEIISALRQAREEQARSPEKGFRPLYGCWDLLTLLGKSGGPDAIEELRQWLNSGSAPEDRALAAKALAEAGDIESAHAIALLIENRDHEWREVHQTLVYALGQLRARDEVPAIRAALKPEPNEAGSSFEVMLLVAGVGALANIDTPQAWDAIVEIATRDNGKNRDTVERTLRDLGRELPQSADVLTPSG